MAEIKDIKKKLDKLLEKFKKKERKGLVLTLLSVVRLSDKGEKVTPENVVSEAKRIIDESPHIDWGVSKDEYNVGIASSLLKELVEMGILDEEETPTGMVYMLARTRSGDPRSEILARFGHLIFYGGIAR